MSELEMNAPPNNPEAERAVLGALLLENSTLGLLQGRLLPEHFYSEAHRLVYEAMLSLAASGSPLDPVTIGNEIMSRGQLDRIGGGMVFGGLIDAVATSANAEHYADIVINLAAVRRMVSASRSVWVRGLENKTPPEEYLRGAEEEILEAARVDSGRAGPERLSDGLGAVFESVTSGTPPAGLVPSGIDVYDRAVGGWWPGLLHIIAGRPGMGKTALALNCAVNAALAGKHALVFSLEDTRYFIHLRVLARFADIDLQKLTMRAVRGADDSRKLIDASNRLYDLPLWIDDNPALTSAEIRQRAVRHRARHGLDVVFVDHLGCLGDPGKSLYEQTTAAVRGLAEIAKALHVPVVCTAQLNRDVENRAGHRPVLADLRQSGEIEQAARVVLFPLRPGYYDEDAGENDHKMTLIVAKQNHGKIGDLPLWCDMSRMFIRGADGANVADAGVRPGHFTEGDRQRHAAGERDY